MWHDAAMLGIARIASALFQDALRWAALLFRSSASIQAENLLLRRQLAMYIERGIRPRRIDPATRVSLAVLARLLDWRGALVVVEPATMLRWHRAGWRLLWRVEARAGRPPIPNELRELIRRMARENPLWGQERIANELLLKLGVRISPRTVSKYLPKRPRGGPRGDMRWSTFVTNHARAILACDFFGTATSGMLLAARRLADLRRVAHSCAVWTRHRMIELVGTAACERVTDANRQECPGRITPTFAVCRPSIPRESVNRFNGALGSARGPPDDLDVRDWNPATSMGAVCAGAREIQVGRTERLVPALRRRR
jgi:hypothetical protein